jgi:hypothetical protein
MRARLRTLRIGAKEFRWTAQLGGPRNVRVRVWGGGKNGCMLRADLEATSDSGRWFDDPDAAYPTPRVVRAIVDYALDHGWDPAAIGGRHILGTDTKVEIPGFRITRLPAALPRP